MGDKSFFQEVLLVCDEAGLIGREMFAIDGCKLPSNASKEWSATKKDFQKIGDRLNLPRFNGHFK